MAGRRGPRMTDLRASAQVTKASERLFAAAQRVLPGGVNSPVRAFRSVGGIPRFIARGEGAWAGNGEHLHVSAVSRIEDAVISTTTESEMPPGWRGLAERAWTPRGFGDFWQHCLVAEGAIDVATDSVLELWDYAAVSLIVAEAGGRCSTFSNGMPAPGESFVSTNGALHNDVVQALRA